MPARAQTSSSTAVPHPAAVLGPQRWQTARKRLPLIRAAFFAFTILLFVDRIVAGLAAISTGEIP